MATIPKMLDINTLVQKMFDLLTDQRACLRAGAVERRLLECA